jgi:hypothetical protein
MANFSGTLRRSKVAHEAGHRAQDMGQVYVLDMLLLIDSSFDVHHLHHLHSEKSACMKSRMTVRHMELRLNHH